MVSPVKPGVAVAGVDTAQGGNRGKGMWSWRQVPPLASNITNSEQKVKPREHHRDVPASTHHVQACPKVHLMGVTAPVLRVFLA